MAWRTMLHGAFSWAACPKREWRQNQTGGVAKREPTRAGSVQLMNGDMTLPRRQGERMSTIRSRVTIKTGSRASCNM